MFGVGWSPVEGTAQETGHDRVNIAVGWRHAHKQRSKTWASCAKEGENEKGKQDVRDKQGSTEPANGVEVPKENQEKLKGNREG